MFDNSNLVLSNFNKLLMYRYKKFILVKFYNNGINLFFCRIDKIINFIPNGS